MCYSTLTALEATMATTEVKRNVNYGADAPWLPQQQGDRNLRMNWVVATAKNERTALRPRWISGVENN